MFVVSDVSRLCCLERMIKRVVEWINH